MSLGFSSFIDFCCLLDGIWVLGIQFEFASFISSFLQNVLDEDVHHVNVFLKLGGSPNSFWDSLLVFCLETFFFVLFIPSFVNLLTPVCFIWHNFHVGFWASFALKLFGLPIGLLGAVACFFLHFSWGDWLHFHKTHYTNNLFGKLVTCCTYQHH